MEHTTPVGTQRSPRRIMRRWLWPTILAVSVLIGVKFFAEWAYSPKSASLASKTGLLLIVVFWGPGLVLDNGAERGAPPAFALLVNSVLYAAVFRAIADLVAWLRERDSLRR